MQKKSGSYSDQSYLYFKKKRLKKRLKFFYITKSIKKIKEKLRIRTHLHNNKANQLFSLKSIAMKVIFKKKKNIFNKLFLLYIINMSIIINTYKL